MPKVYIVGIASDYGIMFRRHGWDIVEIAKNADLVQFTGGEDVTPELYGHTKHKYTYNNPARDRKEQAVFQLCLKAGIPMAGICRGGQFLNVMCGGKMVQHTDGHGCMSGHDVKDERTGEIFKVTSTHHQMMVPHKTEAEVILTARESTFHEKHIAGTEVHYASRKVRDIEALYYPKFKCFCFQPHPEFQNWGDLSDIYFGYLDEFFHLRSAKDVASAFEMDLNDKLPF